MNAEGAHQIVRDLNSCTGCAVCAAACPGSAISMCPDAEGFLFPRIDTISCNDCGLCRTACPVRENCSQDGRPEARAGIRKPASVFAAWHLDTVTRGESSSGGVFTALAETILRHGGVVCGAAFGDDGVVRHILIDSPADLQHLRGSKYVQSEISPACYHRIDALLNQGRQVLFSGTPCQVAALSRYLGKPFDNLFCCEIVCHGVPSPLLLARYLENCRAEGENVRKISFRNKTTGWKTYSISRQGQDGGEILVAASADPYMAAFLHDYSLRPSCYACLFKSTAQGDITLGDFWGVGRKYPEYDRDDKGTSLVVVNTRKGEALLESCHHILFLGKADLDTAIAGNAMLVSSCRRPPGRDTFYQDLADLSFPDLIRKYQLSPVPSAPDASGSFSGKVMDFFHAVIRRRPKEEKSRMKIGIITFHWVDNYGAVLQAYALQTYLSQQGYDARIIDYTPNTPERQYQKQFEGKLTRCLKQCLTIKRPWLMPKKIRDCLDDWQSYRKDWRMVIKEWRFEKFRSRYLNRSRRYDSFEELRMNPPLSDAYMCGSDQIWNPFFTAGGEGKPTLSYFLDFGPVEVRRIAYAVSFGVTRYPQEALDLIYPCVSRFNAVSVRENSGRGILLLCGMENVGVMPDPTLLLTAKDYDRFYLPWQLPKRNHIFFYALHAGQKTIEEIKNYVTRSLHRDIIDAGTPENSMMGITTWLKSIRSADSVVTNSFHGMIFSIIYRKPFIVIPVEGSRSGMNDRIYTLLEKTGLQDRMIEHYDEKRIAAVMAKNIDWDTVEDRIASLRNDARDFFLRNLNQDFPAREMPRDSQTAPGNKSANEGYP
jgi:coenzyme F420-reducing hydrogenase beta subunit